MKAPGPMSPAPKPVEPPKEVNNHSFHDLPQHSSHDLPQHSSHDLLQHFSTYLLTTYPNIPLYLNHELFSGSERAGGDTGMHRHRDFILFYYFFFF
jgi:hypothetical protein